MDIDVTLYTEREIQTAVAELAKKVTATTVGDKPLHVLVVMDGAFMFAADLLRFLNPRFDIRVHFVKATSYTGQVSSGHVSIGFTGSVPNLKNQRVLVVDDIIDTGDTILALHNWLETLGVESFRTVCLFRKLERKTVGRVAASLRASIRHPEKEFTHGVAVDASDAQIFWAIFVQLSEQIINS